MSKLPSFLKKYFWDIDFSKLKPDKSPKYIIERLLEFGDEQAIRWVIKNYSKQKIIDVIKTSRVISFKTANFWSQIFNIKRSEILCFQEPYLTMRKAHWPY